MGAYVNTNAGITAGGRKFVGNDTAFGYGTYLIPASVAADALSLNGSTTLVMSSTFADITRPTGIRAFGTDFGFSDLLKKTGPVDVRFHRHDGTSESLTLDTAQFFAYTGKLIDSIHFDARGLHYPNIDYLMLDNVSIGAVPEPTTYALMLSGLGVLVAVARRRQ